MTPTDIIVLVIIALVIGGASFYIIRAKKKGQNHRQSVAKPYKKPAKP